MNSNKIKWEKGINFSRKIPGYDNKSKSEKGKVGSLSVKIGSVRMFEATSKYFFVIEVCHTKFTSPTIFPDANNILKWEISAIFQVEDLYSDVRILLFRSHLVSDTLVGQVIIPLSTFISPFSLSYNNNVVSGIYELYPLPLTVTAWIRTGPVAWAFAARRTDRSWPISCPSIGPT